MGGLSVGDVAARVQPPRPHIGTHEGYETLTALSPRDPKPEPTCQIACWVSPRGGPRGGPKLALQCFQLEEFTALWKAA